MKALLPMSMLFILMGCLIRGEDSREQTALKLGKAFTKAVDALAPTMKRLVKGGTKADYDELANLLKAGKRSKAAARAFRQTLEKPLDEYAAALQTFKKHSDSYAKSQSPLTKKALDAAADNVKRHEGTAKAMNKQYNEALQGLVARGVKNINELKLKKNPLEKINISKWLDDLKLGEKSFIVGMHLLPIVSTVVVGFLGFTVMALINAFIAPDEYWLALYIEEAEDEIKKIRSVIHKLKVAIKAEKNEALKGKLDEQIKNLEESLEEWEREHVIRREKLQLQKEARQHSH